MRTNILIVTFLLLVGTCFGGMEFDGTTGHGVIPDSDDWDLLPPYTLIVTVKTTDVTAGIVAHFTPSGGYAGWELGVNAGTIRFYDGTAWQFEAPYTFTSELTQIIVTTFGKDYAGNGHLYVDGVEIDTDTLGNLSANGTSPLIFGNSSDFGRYWEGSIYRVQLYKVYFTAEDVTAFRAADGWYNPLETTRRLVGTGYTNYLAHFWNPADTLSTNDLVGNLHAVESFSLDANSSEGWSLFTAGSCVTLPTQLPNGTNYAFAIWTIPYIPEMNANTYGGWLANDRGGADHLDWQMVYSKTTEEIVMTVWDSSDNDVTVINSGAFNDREWVHVMGVVDADNQEVRFYRNGVLTGTTPMTIIPSDTSNLPARFGNGTWTTSGTTAYHGSIDKPRFYNNFAPNDAQAMEIYNSSKRLLVSSVFDTFGARGYADGETMADGTIIYDISGRDHHGVLSNGVTQVTADVPLSEKIIDSSGNDNSSTNSSISSSLVGSEWIGEFDLTQWAYIPDSDDFTLGTNFTILARIKTTNTTGATVSHYDPSATNGFDLDMGSNFANDGKIDFHDGTAWRLNSIGEAVNDGEWQDITVVGAGTTLSLYTNGLLVGTDTLASVANDAAPLIIGGANDSDFTPQRPFLGNMEYIHIYKKAFTSNEVFTASANKVFPSGAVSSYTFMPLTKPSSASDKVNRRR